MVLPSGNDRLALVPVATTSPPTSHEVEAMLPSESDAEAVRATVSPDSPSLSVTVLLPPIIDTTGAILGITGAATVIVTLVLVLSPSSSVARNVTVVLPSGSDRLALVLVATTSPPTSHEVEAMLPSESDAEAVRATVSPDSPSLSDTLRLPPIIDTTGEASLLIVSYFSTSKV